MEVSQIIAEIDAEILKLQQARDLLSNTEPVRRNGSRRPKAGSIAKPIGVAVPRPGKKRKLTAEGRKRIADAMKKRWAERRSALASL